MSTTTLDAAPSYASETTKRDPLAIAGRVIFALPFGVFGLMHLAAPGSMAGVVPSWVPGPGALWVVLTGVALIAAAVSIAIDRLVRWSGPLLALLMLTFVLTVHLPHLLGGDQMAMISLLKDLAFAGAALFFTARK